MKGLAMLDLRAASKDVRRILKELHDQGCTVSRTRSGHWKVTRPGHVSVTMANTLGDPRTLKNIKADVKRFLAISL